MFIRPATPDDLDELYELFSIVQNLHVKARPDIFRPAAKDSLFFAEYETLFSAPNEHVIVADTGDMLAGYIRYLTSHRPQTLYTHPVSILSVREISIRAENRQQGCARQLIDHVKVQAKDLGIRRVVIDHWCFNDVAAKTFEQLGFNSERRTMSLALD